MTEKFLSFLPPRANKSDGLLIKGGLFQKIPHLYFFHTEKYVKYTLNVFNEFCVILKEDNGVFGEITYKTRF